MKLLPKKGRCFAVPNKDNDDLINNILKELDNSKTESANKNEADFSQDSDSNTPLKADENHYSDSNRFTGAKPATIENKSSEKQQLGFKQAEAQNEVKIRKAPQKNNQQNQDKSINPPKKKKRKKKQHSRLPGVLILTTFIFAVSICLALVIIAYGKDMLGIGKSETTHLIVIPEGATTEDISLMLEDDGIIKSPEFFQLFSRLSKADSSYIAGEHFISANMAYETIIQELTSSENDKKESIEITFPEGITLYDAAILLEDNGVCSADDFMFYFNAGGLGFSFEDKLTTSSNLKFYRMEGFLFPDTYYFYVGMEPEQVCQKIYLNFDNKMTDDRYQRMEQLNLNLDQLITFASIVQREAATSDSMTMVASVFWNRLNNPDVFPLLQSDPTRIYAEEVIKPHMEVYDQVMIDAYNTYVGAGLPPGPICNPGIEAIDAVLEAFESDYYYFYANVNTGQTYFATTLDEHNANQEMVEQQIADAEAASNAAGQEG